MKQRSVCLKSVFLGLITVCMFAVGSVHARAQDSTELKVSVGFNQIGFLHAIDILSQSVNNITINFEASLSNPTTHDVDSKKVDITAKVSLEIDDQPVGKVLQAILDNSSTPLTYRRMFNVYTIVQDPSRKVKAHEVEEVHVSGAQSFRFRGLPFDIAIDRLFQTYHLPYRIQPDVTVIKETVTCSITNSRLTEALLAVLGSINHPTEALTFHYEGGTCVITPAEAESANQLPSSTTATNGGWDVDFSGIPLETAINQVLNAHKANYFYTGTLNGTKPVELRGHFDNQESAITAILRAAQPEQMLIYRKENELVTLLPADMLNPFGPPPTSVTCHCSMVFGPLAVALFSAFHKNYRGGGNTNISITLDHASFEEAYKTICKSFPANSVHIVNGMYEFETKE